MTYRPRIRITRPARLQGTSCYAMYAVDADYREGYNEVGEIEMCSKRVGTPRLKVGFSHVAEPYRRHGVGTKLYEAAAELACRMRLRLSSDDVGGLSVYSRGFWDKQVRKGRARLVGSGTTAHYLLLSPCGADLSGLRTRRRRRRRR